MKKNIKIKKSFVNTILILSSLIYFTGCPIEFDISNNKTNGLNISFSTKAGPQINQLISSIGDSNNSSYIFDTFEIEKSLATIGFDNVQAISKKTKTSETLLVKCQVNQNELDFIKIHSLDSIIKKIEITLSPQILQDLILNQDSIIQQYADLLMAPCFTNEEISKEEYIELVKSLYGSEIANELILGNITLSINNSKEKGSTLSIPLIDILTLTEQKTFIVTN